MAHVIKRSLPAINVVCLIASQAMDTYISYIAFAKDEKIRHSIWEMSLFGLGKVGIIMLSYLAYHLFDSGKRLEESGDWLDKKMAGQKPEPLKNYYATPKSIGVLAVCLWTLQIARWYSNTSTTTWQIESVNAESTANFLPIKTFWLLCYASIYVVAPILSLIQVHLVTRKIIDDIKKKKPVYKAKTCGAYVGLAFGILCKVISSAGDIFSTWAANRSQCYGMKHPQTISSVIISVLNNAFFFIAIGQHYNWMEQGDKLKKLCHSQRESQQSTPATELRTAPLLDDNSDSDDARQTSPLFSNGRIIALGLITATLMLSDFIVGEVTQYRTFGELWDAGIHNHCELNVSYRWYVIAMITTMAAGLIDGLAMVQTIITNGLRMVKRNSNCFQDVMHQDDRHRLEAAQTQAAESKYQPPTLDLDLEAARVAPMQ